MLSLSTMWAQQPRFEGEPRRFAETAKALGFTHVEINYAMPPEVVDELGRGSVLPVSSVHQPCPRVRHGNTWSHDLNLASLDDAERQAALDYALGTIDLAATVGAGAVVVHLGAIGNGIRPEERRLREHYGDERLSASELARLRQDLVEWRAGAAPPCFDLARRVLDRLAERARLRGVVIGLEDRYQYHETPSIDELEILLAEHDPATVGYWHDTGHAEVMHRLGLVDREAWLARYGSRTVGSHLHDVDGVTDHRAPGEGDAEWDHLARDLPPSALRVFEVNQHRPDEAVEHGIRLLTERRVL